MIIAGSLVVVSIIVFLFIGRSSSPPVPNGVTGGQPPAQQAAVEQKSARLKAESTPSGATLYVDGIHMGFTPNTVSLEPGKHELIMSLPNHDKWEAQVELEKDTETPVSGTLTPTGKN